MKNIVKFVVFVFCSLTLFSSFFSFFSFFFPSSGLNPKQSELRGFDGLSGMSWEVSDFLADLGNLRETLKKRKLIFCLESLSRGDAS